MTSAFVDLFCGAGAACGFLRAGAEPVLGVDHDAGALTCWAHHAPGRQGALRRAVRRRGAPARARRFAPALQHPLSTLSRQRRATAEEAQEGSPPFASLELPLRRGDHTWSSEQVPDARAVALVQAFERRFPDSSRTPSWTRPTTARPRRARAS